MDNISILIPTRNSENYIEYVLHYLASLNWSNSEIIVIENGSFDNTWERLQLLSNSWNLPTPLICKKTETGLGNAIRVGVYSSTKEYIWFTAQDLPFGLSDIENMYRFRHTNSLLLGSKKYEASKIHRGPMRSFLSNIFRFARFVILRQGFRDTQGTFFASKTLLHSIMSRTCESGYLITTEMVYVCSRSEVGVLEVPVVYAPLVQSRSQLSVSQVLSMFLGLFRIKAHHK